MSNSRCTQKNGSKKWSRMADQDFSPRMRGERGFRIALIAQGVYGPTQAGLAYQAIDCALGENSSITLNCRHILSAP